MAQVWIVCVLCSANGLRYMSVDQIWLSGTNVEIIRAQTLKPWLHLISQCLYLSISVRTRVRFFNYTLQQFSVRYLMVYAFLGENIHNANVNVYHPCPSLKGSSSFPSVSSHGLTDPDMRTQTGVAYASEWLASINGHGHRCTDRCSLALTGLLDG